MLAPSAKRDVRCWASRTKGEQHPTKAEADFLAYGRLRRMDCFVFRRGGLVLVLCRCCVGVGGVFMWLSGIVFGVVGGGRRCQSWCGSVGGVRV